MRENKKLLIPKITDEELITLYKRIKPIVTIEEYKYTLRNYSPEELRKYAYLLNKKKDSRELILMNELQPINEITCLHPYGYYGLFKPTIAEVLSQIPNYLVGTINYFEIISMYDNKTKDGYHKSKVRTYKLHK